MSVSLLTVTQYSRLSFFERLIKQILCQDYVNIIEWIIVNGSKTREDAKLLRKYIKTFKKTFPIKIVYIDWNKKRKFSNMLNVGNDKCKGDIIVIMEDDEYYFSTRVSHAVNKLNENPQILIVGCSSVLCYDTINKLLYKFKHINNSHSCNHALAYKREYLRKHHFFCEKVKPFSIEWSFLDHFTVPMTQLDSEYSLVHSWHSQNTINCYLMIEPWLEHDYMKKYDDDKLLKLLENYYL